MSSLDYFMLPEAMSGTYTEDEDFVGKVSRLTPGGWAMWVCPPGVFERCNGGQMKGINFTLKS